ncbi:MAG: helix-turn-helix domain-containing protein [bacterium]
MSKGSQNVSVKNGVTGVAPLGIYTTNETQDILRISESTIKRLLKRGLLRANKVGGQYRILGKEILRLVSPELERGAARTYLSAKKGVVEKLNRW